MLLCNKRGEEYLALADAWPFFSSKAQNLRDQAGDWFYRAADIRLVMNAVEMLFLLIFACLSVRRRKWKYQLPNHYEIWA